MVILELSAMNHVSLRWEKAEYGSLNGWLARGFAKKHVECPQLYACFKAGKQKGGS